MPVSLAESMSRAYEKDGVAESALARPCCRLVGSNARGENICFFALARPCCRLVGSNARGENICLLSLTITVDILKLTFWVDRLMLRRPQLERMEFRVNTDLNRL